jgi:2-methylcitrate dehydratase PrpD
MLNGAMAQARDFDAVYEPGVLLPYGPIVAAALAAGELAGASGKDLITAVALGTDLTCRLGRSVTSGLGWSRTATLGVFGAALAASVLLRLSERQTVNALGLALSASSGNIQTVIDGSLAKRYQGGFTAENGVKAALLAARGITGPANVFEGRCGYFALYEGGRYRRESVVQGLGEVFEGTAASVKPYPCAREHHGALHAALRIRPELNIDEIESVRVTLPPNAFALSGKPFPENATVGAAIASAAYNVAVALLQGHVGLGDFTREALARPEVLELARRIEVIEDTGVADVKTLVPQSVRVRLKNGDAREAASPVLPGSPELPLEPGELRRKLESCVAHAARPMSAARLSQAVDGLESLASLRELRLDA